MLIHISNDLSGNERKRLLKLRPILYALKLFNGDHGKAASWLGLSRRWINELTKKESELLPYKSCCSSKKLSLLVKREGLKIKNSKLYLYGDEEIKRYINNLLVHLDIPAN